MTTEVGTWDEGWFDAMPVLPSAPLERAACLALLAFAAALQLSIAAADILLTISAILWVAVLVRNRERVEVPRMFRSLAAYAGAMSGVGALNATAPAMPSCAASASSSTR